MPKFISDDDMAKLSPDPSPKKLISDEDMHAMELAESRPGFFDKLKSVPGNVYNAGKTLVTETPSDLKKTYENPGEAADVAARGLSKGASWLDIPDELKLQGEKVIARNLPKALGGMSDEEYQGTYERGDDPALVQANRNREAQLDSKYPALNLASQATGFVAGNNPLSMVAKVGTQSTSRGLNEGLNLKDALVEGGEDAALQAGLTYGPKAVMKGVPKAINAVTGKLDSAAENLAENATGATAVQASKFRPGAGRELLDRGIVGFFDDPENIAQKAGAAKDAAAESINSVLKELDQKGVTASLPNVIDALQQKVTTLSKVPGNEALISKLQGDIDNLSSRAGSDLGPPTAAKSEIPVSMGEEAKRNYANNVNYASPVADQKAAFHTAGAFRNEVERSALAADPAASKAFQTAKDTYGLLAPIEEAANRRSIQLGQNPIGGLHDVAAAGVGGLPGLVAKRALFPRISSSLAVGADKLSKTIKNPPPARWAQAGMDKITNLLKTNPVKLGKFAQPLMNASERGGNALGVAHYLLQSTSPEYQKLMEENDDDSGQRP